MVFYDYMDYNEGNGGDSVKKSPIQNEDKHILLQYGLDPLALKDCHISTFEAGEGILRQGITMDYLYLIVSGKAKVYIHAKNGKSLILCYYVSKEILGDIELSLGNYIAATTAIAVTAFRCIAIPFSKNEAYMKRNVDFMNLISCSLSTKLLSSCNAHAASALHTSEERLCSYILMAEHIGKFTDVLIDVAQSVGMSYRHIFRLMNKLCSSGILEKTQGGYCIRNRELLKQKSL